ncbi:MAG: formylglycine-generating enzyme family protein [Planctomycetota bacterium]
MDLIKDSIDKFSQANKESPYVSTLRGKWDEMYLKNKEREELAFKSAKSRIESASKDIPSVGEVFKDRSTGIEFVYVTGGTFLMGDLFSEGHNAGNHIKEIKQDGFWLSKFEITQGQWKIVMGNNPSHFKNGDNYPVEMVSWNDIQAFIRELNLNHRGRFIFRLPSEAEWEYACREEGRKVKFGNGKNIIDPDMANFNGDSRYKESYSISGVYRKETTPVNSFPPNSLGLHDMSGNVWEWTQSTYKSNNDNFHVIRGGSWNFRPCFLLATSRSYLANDTRIWDTGFRLVLMVETKESF